MKTGLFRLTSKSALAAALVAMLFSAAACDNDHNHLNFLIIPTRTPKPTTAPTTKPTAPPTAKPTPTPTAVPATPTPSPTPPFVNFGVSVVGDDGNGFTNGLQIMTVEDASGKPLPTPLSTFAPLSAGDIDGLSITADGTHGAVIDGGNTVFFFTSDLKTGKVTLLPATVDVSSFGGDGDSIASLPGGDEVVVSGGGSTQLALVSGVLSGTPTIVGGIDTSKMGVEYDALVISDDGKVMLSRSGTGDVLDVYSIAATTPRSPASFTITKTFKAPDIHTLCCDGRGGLASSPPDSSRAVLVSNDGTVQLFTGLPAAPVIANSITLTGGAKAVTISRDGKFAIVALGTGGLAVVGGVDTGTLAQVGSAFSPTVTVPGGSCKLDDPSTLGVMADNKFVVAIQDCGLPRSATDVGSGVLLTIPLSPTGALSTPVGQLNFVVTPDNDQLLVH